MALYFAFVILWTLYMGFENLVYVRPQSRPHFVGFLITNTILAPISFGLSLTGGILRERIKAAYYAATKQKEDFARSGKKKLIG